MDLRGVRRVGAGTMDTLTASFTGCQSTNRGGAKHKLKARGKVAKEMDRTADWLLYVRNIPHFFFKSVCVENVCACANGGSRVREWLTYGIFTA